MIGLAQETDQYVAAFSRFLQERAGQDGRSEASGARRSFLTPIRRQAIARFAEVGFPTASDEEWRKTNVAPIAKTAFRVPPETMAGDSMAAPDLSMVPRPMFSDATAAHELVFVNGRFSRRLSRVGPLPRGIHAGSLARTLASDANELEPYLAKIADPKLSPFTALNAAFMEDGACVLVPDGKVLADPIHLLFLATGPEGETADAPLMLHPRNLIVLGADSQATLVETYAGIGSSRYLTNAVTEIVSQEGSVLDHYRVQLETDRAFHVGRVQAALDRGARISSFSVSLGAALSRNDAAVALTAEGAECALNGLYMASGSQHMDNHTTIDHIRPRCTSRELYKGVLDGKSRAVFNGKIIVRPDASNTDSRQTNRNLLLSEEALVDTKPELQIHNNDVKCNHAAAIGQLDEGAIFYLRTRGLDQEAARSLLIHAFVSEMMGHVKLEPLRDELEALLLARLPGYGGVKEAAL